MPRSRPHRPRRTSGSPPAPRSETRRARGVKAGADGVDRPLRTGSPRRPARSGRAVGPVVPGRHARGHVHADETLAQTRPRTRARSCLAGPAQAIATDRHGGDIGHAPDHRARSASSNHPGPATAPQQPAPRPGRIVGRITLRLGRVRVHGRRCVVCPQHRFEIGQGMSTAPFFPGNFTLPTSPAGSSHKPS